MAVINAASYAGDLIRGKLLKPVQNLTLPESGRYAATTFRGRSKESAPPPRTCETRQLEGPLPHPSLASNIHPAKEACRYAFRIPLFQFAASGRRIFRACGHYRLRRPTTITILTTTTIIAGTVVRGFTTINGSSKLIAINRDFRRLNRDEQKQYWEWRHNHH